MKVSDLLTRMHYGNSSTPPAIEYLIGDMVVDSWIYDKGLITTSEQQDTLHINFAEIRNGNYDTREWIKKLSIRMELNEYPQSKHIFSLGKKNGGVFGKLTFIDESGSNEEVVINAEWEHDTDVVTFQPRKEFKRCWADFCLYVNCYTDIIQKIKGYKLELEWKKDNGAVI